MASVAPGRQSVQAPDDVSHQAAARPTACNQPAACTLASRQPLVSSRPAWVENCALRPAFLQTPCRRPASGQKSVPPGCRQMSSRRLAYRRSVPPARHRSSCPRMGGFPHPAWAQTAPLAVRLKQAQGRPSSTPVSLLGRLADVLSQTSLGLSQILPDPNRILPDLVRFEPAHREPASKNRTTYPYQTTSWVGSP